MYCSSRSFYQTKRQSSDNQIAPHKSSLFAHRFGLSHKPGPLSGHRPFSSKHSLFLQPRLTIGQPNDKYEQEADRVADEVMRMPEPGVQRQTEEEEEEEELIQTKPLAEQITPLVQRQAEPEEDEEEEEPVQTKQTGGQAPQVSPSLEAQIQSLKGRGKPLPESDRAFFEPRLGYDFRQVRVHCAGTADCARAPAAGDGSSHSTSATETTDNRNAETAGRGHYRGTTIHDYREERDQPG
jgi:hypothetical protein